jgi:hypothetical protein
MPELIMRQYHSVGSLSGPLYQDAINAVRFNAVVHVLAHCVVVDQYEFLNHSRESGISRVLSRQYMQRREVTLMTRMLCR